MRVELTQSDLTRYVDEKVQRGEFPSPEAVVEDALLRMIESEEKLSDDDLHAIEQAELEIDRGEFIEFDTFAAEMRKKYCGGTR